MKCAIVTGANSFVGSATVKELLNNGYFVYAIVHEKHDNIPPSEMVKIIQCDMSDYSDLLETIKSRDIEFFFHFAWAGASGDKRSDYVLQLQNVQYSIDAIKVAKEIGCKRFVGAGSIIEHESISAVLSDGNKPGLNYIYGYSKLTSHLMCSSVAAKIGIDIVWPLITNSYGVGEKSPRLVNTTLRKCIDSISPEFTSGTQNYDFVYIDDVARAFRLIAENGRPFTEYLIGSSNAKPLKDFLLEMKSVVAPDLDFKFGNVPFTGVNLSLKEYDCSKTEADTGFRSSISFAEGCKKTIEWLRGLHGTEI